MPDASASEPALQACHVAQVAAAAALSGSLLVVHSLMQLTADKIVHILRNVSSVDFPESE